MRRFLRGTARAVGRGIRALANRGRTVTLNRGAGGDEVAE